MSFTPDEKKNLFNRLTKIEISLTDINGRIRGSDKDLNTLNTRGCEHGVKRYEALNQKIELSRLDLLQAIDGRMKNYKIVAGCSGVIGLFGGYFLKHLS